MYTSLNLKYDSQFLTKKKRNFYPFYLKDKPQLTKYSVDGFLVIKNVVSEDIITHMTDFFEELRNQGLLEFSESFLNSGRVKSESTRKKVVSFIKKISDEILYPLVDINLCDIETGGAFQIKPSGKSSQLNPHQDTPIIDETEFYAMYVWIPLCDVNNQNGTLSVLPGSHLWGNHQRSLNVPWVYENISNDFWKDMINLDVKKGDLICFDSALIHGSKANLSKQTRVAFTCAILPKNFQLVHYYKDDKIPSEKVEKYYVWTFFKRDGTRK